jgi:hypothetical protein
MATNPIGFACVSAISSVRLTDWSLIYVLPATSCTEGQ